MLTGIGVGAGGSQRVNGAVVSPRVFVEKSALAKLSHLSD